MYVERVRNRNSPPAILLRESWREGKKVRKRTLANLSSWPKQRVEALRRVLRDETLVPASEAFEIVRSLPHGHVAAALGTLRQLGLERVLHARKSRERDLVVALIVERILDPDSKLSTARGLGETSSLAEVLGLGEVEVEELYQAMDGLLMRQAKVERALARKHLREGCLVLYDVTSVYFEGSCCPLAQHGYSREHRGDRPQIVIKSWIDHRSGGSADRGGGLRGQHRRSLHARLTAEEASGAFRAAACGGGGRSGDADRRAHPRGA